MPSEHEKALLKEYELCDKQANRLEGLIWQMAAILFPISLAGLAYFGLSANHTSEQFFTLVAAAIGSIALILTWNTLSRTQYAYRHVAYHRMREIESQLGLWYNRYSHFISKSKNEKKKAVEDSTKDERARIKELEDEVRGSTRFGFRAMTAVVTLLFVFGWATLLVRECILTFKRCW